VVLSPHQEQLAVHRCGVSPTIGQYRRMARAGAAAGIDSVMATSISNCHIDGSKEEPQKFADFLKRKAYWRIDKIL